MKVQLHPFVGIISSTVQRMPTLVRTTEGTRCVTRDNAHRQTFACIGRCRSWARGVDTPHSFWYSINEYLSLRDYVDCVLISSKAAQSYERCQVHRSAQHLARATKPRTSSTSEKCRAIRISCRHKKVSRLHVHGLTKFELKGVKRSTWEVRHLLNPLRSCSCISCLRGVRYDPVPASYG
jgi:hypothetical protein